jgi:nucleotide-binding universal stress UspA family protein
MYRHILVPVDCTDDARREAHRLARYVGPMNATKVTVAATITPSPDPQIHQKKVAHANGALAAIADILHGYGIHARRRIVEGADAACALTAEEKDDLENYDLIVMGTHQTRSEIDDFPCRGSLADQIAQRTSLPIIILPGNPPAIGVGA